MSVQQNELAAAIEVALAASCLAKNGNIEFDLKGRLVCDGQRRRSMF